MVRLYIKTMTLKKILCLICVTILLTFFAATSFAENSKVNHRLSLGARWHMDHSEFEELPFDDGDIGYLMAYEYHEGLGFWQVGVDYVKDPNKIMYNETELNTFYVYVTLRCAIKLFKGISYEAYKAWLIYRNGASR